MSDPNIDLFAFKIFRTLGQGSFGRVILAYRKDDRKFYALKLINKMKILKEKQIDHAINEKRILFACSHPNIVKLCFIFKDNSFLYFGIELIAGGDLYRHLKEAKRFNESKARFYAAQILSCFEYLHSCNVIYRDLKPENVLITAKGYLKLVDFGFAKYIEKRTYTLCGTPDYFCPEILKHQAYRMSVDWWSFGVFCFELNNGEPPFKGKTHKQLYESILTGKYKCPPHFSSELIDLCQKLMQIEPTMRLGCMKRGTLEVIEHPWFKGVDWNRLYHQTLPVPYMPAKKSPLLMALYKSTKREEPLSIAEVDIYAENFINF